MEFAGSPQEIGDQVERLRGLQRRLEVRARNRLLTGLLGVGGLGLTLVVHMMLHPGNKVALTTPERISLAVSALVAAVGMIAFHLTPRGESRRLRLVAGLLQFWSSGQASLTLDLSPLESESYDQTWLKLQVDDLHLSVRRIGTSWLHKNQRQYQYHELCEIVTTAPNQPLSPIRPNPRFANLSIQESDGEIRIQVQSPTTTLNAPENLEAVDLFALLQVVQEAASA